MRRPVTASTIAWTSRENAPVRLRAAARAAVALGRVDQVGDALGLREVELAVQERAAGELARLGDARAERDAAREQQAHRGGAAVPVELDDGLAGVRRRRGKRDREPLVDRRAVRVAERRERSMARRQRRAGDRVRDRHHARGGAGYADDADAAATGRRRDRGDGRGRAQDFGFSASRACARSTSPARTSLYAV
jgi:hypothetical protein